jgi:hypothetical protein
VAVRHFHFIGRKMEIKITIDVAKLSEAFRRMAEQTRIELRTGMKKALGEIRDRARINHRFVSRSGAAERSIQYQTDHLGLEGRVGINEGIAKHARYQHEGTGLYGKYGRRIVVVPKTRKSLYWVQDGNKCFSKRVEIDGIVKDQFIYRAAELLEKKTVETIGEYVGIALKKAGLI